MSFNEFFKKTRIIKFIFFKERNNYIDDSALFLLISGNKSLEGLFKSLLSILLTRLVIQVYLFVLFRKSEL